MAERTILLFDRTAIAVTSLSGSPPRNGDVINNAQNGNSFSWEVPDDLRFVFPTATVAVTFDDADGILTDDPYGPDGSGSQNVVLDQRLTQPVTIGGTSWTPNSETIRWKWPPPVTVEAEYEVVLYDAGGTAYTMVGVSIVSAWNVNVVGVMFEGAQPPPGEPLYYRQGQSTYTQHGSTPVPGGVACFHAGTMIETPRGPRRIEDLAVGDKVLTLDRGALPLRWLGRSRVDGTGALAPIRVMAGALGNRRDLWLSPNHRVFLRAARAELWFGSAEVLVAVKHLVDGRSIRSDPRPVADYLHLALDSHEMIFSEGIATESLFMGEGALSTLDAAARAELLAIFPDLASRSGELGRRGLTATEARVIRSLWRPEREAVAGAA